MPDPQITSCGTLADMYAICAKRYSDRTAMVHGDRRISYKEAQEQTLSLAHALKSLGLKRGDAIAILAGNMPEVAFLISATQLMGIRYTALHALGSEEDHAFILEDAGIATLIVDSASFAQRGQTLLDRVPGLGRLLTFGPSEYGTDLLQVMEKFDPIPLQIEAEADDIALVAYTGGTTGQPKGVVHTQGTLLSMTKIELAEWEWPQDIRFLAAAPVSHAVAGMLLPTFHRGGTFVFANGFNPATFMSIVEKERINSTFLVPTMLYALLDHPERGDYDLSSLEMVIYGAAPILPARLAQAIETFGPVFCQIYGQIEAPNLLTYLRKTDHDLSRPSLFSSCGMPVVGIQLKLLDEEMNEVPCGEIGEVCARGPHIMDRYWNRKEESETVTRGNWLHTGDLAKCDEDGYIHIVDRTKDMIISGGFNVYPSEIEEILAHHGAVASCAVIGVPDPQWGEAVKAVVVLKADQSCTASELISYVRDRKGPVQAPKTIEFVENVPLTPLGKVDKKELKRIYRN